MAAAALLAPAASVAAPGTIFHVNSTADTSGCTTTTCTLRGAIAAANAASGKDRIVFDLARGSVIKPGSVLPTVGDGVTIDGTGNSCAGGAPTIVLNGSKLSGTANLLTASVGGVTICGLVVQAATGSGILLTSKGGDTVVDNYIGTDVTGTTAVPNGVTKTGLATGGAGLTIASPNNVVGGTSPAARNLISGNILGVRITGATATGNVVQGNFIGTTAAGSALLGNGQDTPMLVQAAGNTIGGTTGTTPGGACSGACNVIAGGRSVGLLVDGGSASGNQILGNFIGTNAAGTAKIANSGVGVDVRNAPNNTVGGASAAARNLISGNGTGVLIENVAVSGNATGNRVLGNYIGTTTNGTAALGNANYGVSILTGTNTLGGIGVGNLISGNGVDGVRIAGTVASGNQVLGNTIGLDATGAARLANALEGVRVASAPNNTIGGSAAGAGNVISGNGDVAVFIYNDANVAGNANGNQLLGNRIGTNPAGTAAVANSFGGIFISGPAGSTVIGGSDAGARNVISGNVRNGITIVNGSSANQVLGNFIGTGAAGGGDLGNAWSGVSIQGSSNNVVGAVGAGNVISGNDVDGVQVVGGASGNQLVANTIGLDSSGTAAVGNTVEGVRLAGSPNNVVGGTAGGAGNTISGNLDAGIFIYNDANPGNSTGNQVLGNLIGTNATGTSALGNGTSGVFVSNAGPALIGGSAAGARNVISGNGTQGITITNGSAAGSQVLGNYIGTDVSGSLGLANLGAGVFILGPNNTVGGTTGTTPGGACTGACNVISGNRIRSLEISGSPASGNQVLGNFIGLTASGGAKVPGASEGVLIVGASGNTIGGTTATARNVISGSSADGVLIFNNANGNQVTGNYIGTNSAGSAAIGNLGSGVRIITAANNVLGGTTGTTAGGACTGACNLISGNSRGVSVESSSSTGNRISANSIVDNTQLGIDLGGDGPTPNGSGPTGPNAFQNHPVLASATSVSGTTTIVGTLPGSSGTFRIEFFASPSCDGSGSGEGKTFLGALDVSPNAQFSFASFAAPPGYVVTATAIDGSGNTSEFSECVPVKAKPTIATTLSATTISAGGQAHDTATLSGATADASGTVTYKVYDNASCSGSPVADGGTKAVSGGGVPDSNTVSFSAAGSYYWQAVYNGDSKNLPATSSCSDEKLTVDKAAPAISTSLSAASIAAGGSASDSATLTGKTGNAGGTVTYTVYSDSACSQGARGAGTVNVTNGSVPDSNALVFTTAGTYYWQAAYSGDANNAAVTSACTDEQLTVGSNTGPAGIDLGTLGGTYSQASAVNGSGQVVGTSSNVSGANHAFLWTQAGEMVDLGTLPGGTNSGAAAVNASGQVAGSSEVDSAGDFHAFLWTQAGGMVDLGTLGGPQSVAVAITDDGQVIGRSDVLVNGVGHTHAFSWTQAGGMVDLGTLPGGTSSLANAVNESGQVVGESGTTGGDHPFSWTQAGGMVDLGTLGGSDGAATAVNASGEVVGEAYAADGGNHAFSWTQVGGMVDLGTLGGRNSFARAVNGNGQVAGESQFAAGDFDEHAFFWSQPGGMVDLGTLGGNNSEATAMNIRGEVVGHSEISGGAVKAFFWTQAGGMVELGSLGGSESKANAVNDNGQVVGYSFTAGDAEVHATLWQLPCDPATEIC